jgi:hypothetical protein
MLGDGRRSAVTHSKERYMPRQIIDLLQPNETLVPGEFLMSTDKRFRLNFEQDGTLIAYAYTPDRGIKRFWRSPSAGANASLRLRRANHPQFPAPQRSFPAAILSNSAGQRIWSSWGTNFGVPIWDNLFLAMQSDGNLVHYARATTTGHVAATWASDTYTMWESRVAIPPNTPIAEITGPGTLILQPNAGDTDIVNTTSELVAARSGTHVVPIPPNSSISLATSGTVLIETVSYFWNDLTAPDGTNALKNSADAIPVPRPTTSQRRRVEILGGGGLTLRGLFVRPELEFTDNLLVSGTNESLNQEPALPEQESSHCAKSQEP